MIKPNKLKKGDTIGVVAPSSPIIGIKVEELDQARKIVENDGFIVKYSKRSPREILEMLFYEPTVTLEHIKTQMAGGTKENMKNAAMACSYCNGAIRGHIPMDIFVAENPKIEKNMKKQFDFLIKTGQRKQKLKHIRENQTGEMNMYVSGIAQTYMRESKGRLHLEEYV